MYHSVTLNGNHQKVEIMNEQIELSYIDHNGQSEINKFRHIDDAVKFARRNGYRAWHVFSSRHNAIMASYEAVAPADVLAQDYINSIV